jgi:hypothetical protein
MNARKAPSRRALLTRTAALLGLPAVGCSLLIPLDYTGGTIAAGQAGLAGGIPPLVGGSSDQGGSGAGSDLGGSAGRGGSISNGGRGGTSGTGDEGPGGEAGTGASGGAQGAGGSEAGGGGEGGESGADGMGGQSESGGIGGLGGTAGQAAGGASAGISGGGMAGSGACPGVDLMTDPEHCGSCTKVCVPNADCIGGVCITSPCQGLCAPAVELPLGNDGYRKDNIGTGATCHQVSAYNPAPNLPSIIAWSFVEPRTLKVNGVAVTVMVEPGAPLSMPRRAGGYCIQAGPGDHDYAGYKLPLPALLTP